MKIFLFLFLFINILHSEDILRQSITQFKGLNNQLTPLLVPPNYAVSNQNSNTSKDGTLTNEIGFSTISAPSGTTGAVLSIYNYRKSDGSDWIIEQIGTNVYLSRGDGNYTLIMASFSTTNPLQFATCQDYLFATNGEDKLRYTDGVNESVELDLYAKYILADKNTLFLFNTKKDPSEFRWLMVNTQGNLDPTKIENWKDTNSHYINKGDGSQGTGMVSYQGKILLFKRYSIWASIGYISDYYNNTDEVVLKTNEYGCIDNNAIKVINGEVYFPSEKGVIKYNGQTFDRISIPIEKYYKALQNINGEEMRWLQNSASHFAINTSSYGIVDNAADIEIQRIDKVWSTVSDFTGAYSSNVYINSGGVQLATTTLASLTRIDTTNKLSPIITKIDVYNQTSNTLVQNPNYIVNTNSDDKGIIYMDRSTNVIADESKWNNNVGKFSVKLSVGLGQKVKKVVMTLDTSMTYASSILNLVNDLNLGYGWDYYDNGGNPVGMSQILPTNQPFFVTGNRGGYHLLYEMFIAFMQNSLNIWNYSKGSYDTFNWQYDSSKRVFTVDNLDIDTTNGGLDIMFYTWNKRCQASLSSTNPESMNLSLGISDISVYTSTEQNVYKTSGTVEMSIYDTTITNPAWGNFNANINISTSTWINFWLSSSASSTTWAGSWIQVSTGTNVYNILPRNRFVKVMAVSTSCATNETPIIYNISLEVTKSSAQFISQKYNVGVNVSQYKNLTILQTLPAGTTIEYKMNFATSSAMLDTLRVANSWIILSSKTTDGVITTDLSNYGTTGYFFQYRLDLFSEKGSSVPIMDSLSLTWYENGINRPMYASDYNNEYWLSVNHGSTYNNEVLKYDKNGEWHILKNYNMNCSTIYKNKLYFGSSVNGTLGIIDYNNPVYQLGINTSTMTWKTGSMLLGNIDRDKTDVFIYVTGNQNANSTFSLDWFINEEDTARHTWTVDLSTPTGIIRKRYNVPKSYTSNIKSCALQVQSTNYLQLLNINIYTGSIDHELR